MEYNYKPVDWSNYPPIEKYTSFGDANDNKLDVAIDERVIALDASKLVMPTPEEIQKLQKCEEARGVYRVV